MMDVWKVRMLVRDRFIYAVHCKDVLCKVDSNRYDCHDFHSKKQVS